MAVSLTSVFLCSQAPARVMKGVKRVLVMGNDKVAGIIARAYRSASAL